MNQTAIILVNYKNPKVTFECIESLQQLSRKNFTIFVVDNGADEKSEDTFRKSRYWGIIEYIRSNENLGFAGGNNLAIRKALKDDYEYILLLNNDTVVDNWFLDEMLRYCNQNTVVVPKIYYFDEPNIIWYAGGRIDWIRGDTFHIGAGRKDDASYGKVTKTEFASGCCMLIHRDVIKKVGYLDEGYFMYYEDTDYCARLAKNNIDILYVPTAKIWHKVGSSSNGEYSKFTAYYMAKNRLRFISKYNDKMLRRAYIRTIASGIKGYLLNKNSKVSIKAWRDFVKEQRN